MSEMELVVRSVVYALIALMIAAGCFHWGWQQRERLALKLDYFRVSPTRWREYDDEVRAAKGTLPKKAELHSIDERQSGR